jgi:hypothetical protein
MGRKAPYLFIYAGNRPNSIDIRHWQCRGNFRADIANTCNIHEQDPFLGFATKGRNSKGRISQKGITFIGSKKDRNGYQNSTLNVVALRVGPFGT